MNPIEEAKLAHETLRLWREGKVTLTPDVTALIEAATEEIGKTMRAEEQHIILPLERRVKELEDALAAASAGGGHARNCGCCDACDGFPSLVDPRCSQPRPEPPTTVTDQLLLVSEYAQMLTDPGMTPDQVANARNWIHPAIQELRRRMRESRPECDCIELFIEMLTAPGRHLVSWDGAWTQEVIDEIKTSIQMGNAASSVCPRQTSKTVSEFDARRDEAARLPRPELPSEEELAKVMYAASISVNRLVVISWENLWPETRTHWKLIARGTLSLLRGGEAP